MRQAVQDGRLDQGAVGRRHLHRRQRAAHVVAVAALGAIGEPQPHRATEGVGADRGREGLGLEHNLTAPVHGVVADPQASIDRSRHAGGVVGLR